MKQLEEKNIKKIICIVGSTGTGKTKKALELASNAPSIIISADSRQVYRGMDIVTGKDHPKDIKIHGIDIVDPDDSCSVSVWYDAISPIIHNSSPNIQIIVVGGTGLYVKALTHGIETMRVPINHILREELESLSINELQEKLKEIDKSKFESLNNSDLHNPRRLIRAIEVYKGRTLANTGQGSVLLLPEPTLIGLRYSDVLASPGGGSIQKNKIHDRVISRLELGAIEETKCLLAKYGKNIQSMSGIGYQSIIKYLENTLSYDQMITDWVTGEMQYAKRQMTWFRKQEVIWYDIDNYGNTKN